MYTWILSTGWWETRAPVNPDAVFVTGFLCISLICGFIYINRQDFTWHTSQSMFFFLQSKNPWRLIDLNIFICCFAFVEWNSLPPFQSDLMNLSGWSWQLRVCIVFGVLVKYIGLILGNPQSVKRLTLEFSYFSPFSSSYLTVCV